MAQDLEHLLDLIVATEDRRSAVLPREQVQVRGEVLEERGSSKRFFSRSSRISMSAHPGRASETEHLGFDTMSADDRHRNALTLSKMAEKDRLLRSSGAGAAGVVERELEHQLRRRRDAHVAAGEGRHHVQVLFECLEDGVRV